MTLKEKLGETHQKYLLSAANETALRRKLELTKSETDAYADQVRLLEHLIEEQNKEQEGE